MTFDVDHTKLSRGIYVSESKVVGDREIITYDIRVCAPYRDEVMSNEVLHSIEHILAVRLSELMGNDSEIDKIYFGPMGCQTGFYLLVSAPIGNVDTDVKVAGMLMKAARGAKVDEVVPFNNRMVCGNCRTLEYTTETKYYLTVIENISVDVIRDKECKKYPKIEDIDVSVVYHVRFKDSVVQVVTNELSLDQVKEIAKDCGDSGIFVERMKEFIKSS